MLKYASHIIITENANMNLSEIMKWLAAPGVFPDEESVTAFREAGLHPVSSGEMAEGWAHLFQILWRVAPHTAEMLWKTLTCKSIAPRYSAMVSFYAAWYSLYSPRYRGSKNVPDEIDRLRLPLHEPQDLGQLIREDDHDYHQKLYVGLENFSAPIQGIFPLWWVSVHCSPLARQLRATSCCSVIHPADKDLAVAVWYWPWSRCEA